MVAKVDKYDFSFTASSLRLNEMLIVAKSIKEESEIDFVNQLGAGKSSTGKRMLSEFKKRISNLTSEQIDLFLSSDFEIQKQIAFVSVCKTYGFIRDFVIEVVREKFMVFDYEITEGDFISFYRRKFDLHEEMETLTDLTEKKIKQVTFKILEQSGIINDVKNREIQPQFIDSKLINVLIKDNPNWLKFFLLPDVDIERAKN